MLTDYKINVKLKLAALWTSLMFLYIYCDYFELKTPGKIESLINLHTPVGEATPKLLVIFSLIMIVPTLMICLSALLRPKLNKWLNIAVATALSCISLLILTGNLTNFDPWYLFYGLYQVVELVVLGIIIYSAWRWPKVAIS
ncbi:hypothetical protein C900_02088 [Fulvivirga imtechensis AK7]|uniref:Uncharacterized protein n=1 Tax=Fulvivirga imtechensis AK7 TaxID=1237149 RepID=L8K186_9BACT|nr:DUF6326 family protein [Fulvivirga imtechensis]ELR73684.1 hypothetical protein C900_02088 [Fulvivirga imtechensis AK7]